MNKDFDVKSIIKYAGAFIAFNMGAGFATGQELLQFFTGYGYFSIWTIFISMFIFSFIGSRIMVAGFDNKNNELKSIYALFCGKYVGNFFDWVVIVKQFAVIVIMISGTGAIFSQYFGLPHYVGAAMLAITILILYFLGIKRIVDISGAIGPIVIIFTLIIGFVTLALNETGITKVDATIGQLNIITSGDNWIMSGFLYSSYVLFGAVPYFAALGKSASNRKDALYGGITGGIVLMSATLVINLAMLLKIDIIYDKQVPLLFLADCISPAMGVIFTIILLMGIFVSTAPKMWIVCNKISVEGSLINKISAMVIILAAFLGGQFSFGKLISFIYPYIGYMSLWLIVCIVYKFLTNCHYKKIT